jgi:hypothetical protein
MTPWLRILLILVFVCLPLVSGCSGDKDKKEKGVIEQQTDKAAKEAVKMIKTPLDEAKTAAKQQEDYTKQVKEETTK